MRLRESSLLNILKIIESAWVCDISAQNLVPTTSVFVLWFESNVCGLWIQVKQLIFYKKYKTFSVLIYSYINTSGNWKNEKLCGNTTPEGRSVFTQFRVFPIFTSVDITIYQHGKCFIFFYNIAIADFGRYAFEFRAAGNFLCWHRVISTRLLANQHSEFANAIL